MRSRGLVVDDELGVDLVAVVHNELAMLLIATRRNNRIISGTSSSRLLRGTSLVSKICVGVIHVTQQHPTVPSKIEKHIIVCVLRSDGQMTHVHRS